MKNNGIDKRKMLDKRELLMSMRKELLELPATIAIYKNVRPEISELFFQVKRINTLLMELQTFSRLVIDDKIEEIEKTLEVDK